MCGQCLVAFEDNDVMMADRGSCFFKFNKTFCVAYSWPIAMRECDVMSGIMCMVWAAGGRFGMSISPLCVQ